MKPEKKHLKFLLVVVIISLVFFSFPSFVEGAIPDFLSHAMKKITGFLGPLLSVLVFSFFVFFIGAAGVYITTHLLQWVIDITPEALTVLSGDSSQIVQAGWHFTSGITNMLLIIAFVFVAIATILGVEKYQLQKLLPKLVVVALLVNFTLLFVGMGIDISNFLFNSVADLFSGEKNILLSAISPLFNIIDNIVLGFLAILSTYALMAVIPGVAVAKAAVQLIVGPFILFPLILEWLFIGFIMISMSVLFFLFFLIFLMRIFIVQILAILSPLAFFCLIFPDTENTWRLWLKHLVSWLFVGVVFIFLMYIGLGLAPLVMEMGDTDFDGFPWWLDWLAAPILSYIILAAYFLVVFAVTRRFIPELAQTAINSTVNMGKQLLPFATPYIQGGKGFFEHTAKQHAERGGKDASKVAEEWSTAAPVRGQGVYKRVTSGIGSLAKRAASKPLISGLEADKKQVDDFIDYYKNASDAVKKRDFENASKMLKQNDRESQNKILALDLADHRKEREETFVGNKKFFDAQRNKAKAIGKGDDFDRLYFNALVKHEGLTESEIEKKIPNLVKSEDHAKQMTKTLAEAMKSMDQNNRAIGEKTYRALLKQKDTGIVKNITKNMKDGEGYKNIDMILRQEAALSVTGKTSYNDITPTELTSITKDQMGRSLKRINSNLHKELSRNPGSALTEAEIKTNQSPL